MLKFLYAPILILMTLYSNHVFCQMDKKEASYNKLISILLDEYPDEEINFNLQLKTKIPTKVAAPGVLPSKILEIEMVNDTTLYKLMKKNWSSDKVSLTNDESDKMVKKYSVNENKKLFINIYEPICFWLDYYEQLFNEIGSAKYEPLYIPVKTTELNYQDKSKAPELRIYVIDINSDEPKIINVVKV